MAEEHLTRAVVVAVVASSAAAALAASAAGSNELIRPGVGIGKVKLGMTLAQVRAVWGRETLVNRRERRGFAQYLELDYGYGNYTVGLLGRPGRLRVISIATALRRERIAGKRVGVGSSDAALRRAYPRIACDYVQTRTRNIVETLGRRCVVSSARGSQLVFFFRYHWTQSREPTVTEVIVEW